MSTWHPRSGYDTALGYVWLPRMLEKARRARTEPLAGYVCFEASPLDSFALGRWRVTGAQVAGWLDEGLDDEAIAQRIADANGHDQAARERWSRRFTLLYGLFMTGIDADEGRRAPGPTTTLLKVQLEVIFAVVSLRNRLLGLG